MRRNPDTNLISRQDLLYYQHGCRYVMVLPDGKTLYAKTRAGADKVAHEQGVALYELGDTGSRQPLGQASPVALPQPLEVRHEDLDTRPEPAHTDDEDPHASHDAAPHIDEDDEKAATQGTEVAPEASGAIMACGLDVRDVLRQCYAALGMDYDKRTPTLGVRFRNKRGSPGHAWPNKGSAGHIALSLGYDCDAAGLWELALHECTHIAFFPKRRESRRRLVGVHGLEFKLALCKAAEKLWGIKVSPYTKGRYGCDPLIEQELRALGYLTPRDHGRKGKARAALTAAIYKEKGRETRRKLIEAQLPLGHKFAGMKYFSVVDDLGYKKSLKWLYTHGVEGHEYEVEYTLKESWRLPVHTRARMPTDVEVAEHLRELGIEPPPEVRRRTRRDGPPPYNQRLLERENAVRDRIAWAVGGVKCNIRDARVFPLAIEPGQPTVTITQKLWTLKQLYKQGESGKTYRIWIDAYTEYDGWTNERVDVTLP